MVFVVRHHPLWHILDHDSPVRHNTVFDPELEHSGQLAPAWLLPFGCRAHVVRPKKYIRKGDIDAHAWVGATHGRAAHLRPAPTMSE